MNENKWFAVGFDGILYYLGEYDGFEDADEQAEKKIRGGGVWLTRGEDVQQWLDTLSVELGKQVPGENPIKELYSRLWLKLDLKPRPYPEDNLADSIVTAVNDLYESDRRGWKSATQVHVQNEQIKQLEEQVLTFRNANAEKVMEIHELRKQVTDKQALSPVLLELVRHVFRFGLTFGWMQEAADILNEDMSLVDIAERLTHITGEKR